MSPDKYGVMYANMHIAIAPLQMNEFNDCYAKGTEVLMYDGTIKLVENIVVGDKLMGPDSTPRNVLRLSSGINDMVEIIPKKGSSFKVTTNHILPLKTNDKNILSRKKSKYTQYKQMTVSHYLKYASNVIRSNYRLYKTGVDFEEKTVEVDPYIVGLMLGDGSLTQGRCGITTEDIEIKESFQQYAMFCG